MKVLAMRSMWLLCCVPWFGCDGAVNDPFCKRGARNAEQRVHHVD